MTVLVIYHSECNDGVTGAWVIKQKFPNAQFYKARYGDSPPNVDNKDVILVDFSYSGNDLKYILENSRSLIILDHHKTAKSDIENIKHEKIKDIVFDMDRSGAGIAWDYFFPSSPRPMIVDRVEDNDLWKFKYDDTRAFVESLRAFPLSIESVDMINRLISGNIIQYNAFISMGSNIRAFKDELVKQSIEQAHEISLDGHKVFASNVPYFLSSDVANELIRDRAFGVTYYKDDKNKWKVSLRSDDSKEDVSIIAKKFGGGGHRNASGFVVEKLPW